MANMSSRKQTNAEQRIIYQLLASINMKHNQRPSGDKMFRKDWTRLLASILKFLLSLRCTCKVKGWMSLKSKKSELSVIFNAHRIIIKLYISACGSFPTLDFWLPL